MTDWITTLYERYAQLFGDPDEPTRAPATMPPSERAPAAAPLMTSTAVTTPAAGPSAR